MKLPAELNAVKTYLRENFKGHPYLYSSSTIAAGSACSMASEKYSSRVGRKTLKVYEKTGQIFEIKQKPLSAWKYAKISLARQQLLGTCVSCSVTCYRLCKPPNCPGINSKDESTHCCNKEKNMMRSEFAQFPSLDSRPILGEVSVTCRSSSRSIHLSTVERLLSN